MYKRQVQRSITPSVLPKGGARGPTRHSRGRPIPPTATGPRVRPEISGRGGRPPYPTRGGRPAHKPPPENSRPHRPARFPPGRPVWFVPLVCPTHPSQPGQSCLVVSRPGPAGRLGDTVRAVSYTHLDVYKRQREGRTIRRPALSPHSSHAQRGTPCRLLRLLLVVLWWRLVAGDGVG